MSVKATLLRSAALALVLGVAIAIPSTAKADVLGGLSIRVGAFMPSTDTVRSLTDFAAFGGGIEYKIPWFPKLLTGESWSTSLSVDFHYSDRKAGIGRYIPVSINQVYTFEEQNGHTPYAGFCITAATFGTTGGKLGSNPTITRFGGGLIAGLNLDSHMYIEGRYEFFDKHHAYATPEGFRAYLGYRF